MLQNTYGNKGLDTLFGPGRIPDFWTPIVKNIRVFVHPIKKPSQAQGFWTYIHASGCLLVRSFRKHNTQLASLSWPKPVCLWWFLHFQARCMYVCMHAGIWKLKKSSFDQALQNASKHLRPDGSISEDILFLLLKIQTKACPFGDFVTKCRAWVEVYINATGES